MRLGASIVGGIEVIVAIVGAISGCVRCCGDQGDGLDTKMVSKIDCLPGIGALNSFSGDVGSRASSIKIWPGGEGAIEHLFFKIMVFKELK